MGVMKLSKTLFQNLFRKPDTKMYPVIQREYTERTKGHIGIDIENCLFCGMCARKCPCHAITVDRNSKTWSISRMQCIMCRCCVGYCPKHCLTMENTYTPPSTTKVVDTFTFVPPPAEEAPAETPAAE